MRMAKKKSKKERAKASAIPKTSLQELQASRSGGQVALEGFTYQLLYSCYLILLDSNPATEFRFEGIEDIDKITYKGPSESVTHVQIKYSTRKQNASFLKDILKNFLEAYLLDPTRNFRLVYDFPVATGHMSKLFNNTLDKDSALYWEQVTSEIQASTPLWNWVGFSFEGFLQKLTFHNVKKLMLVEAIEKKLIESYDITTGNIRLFANALTVCCLDKMRLGASINQHELNVLIQAVKDDINKGGHNPAYAWIQKLDFNVSEPLMSSDYLEGKKPTPQDIVQGLPVRRPQLEIEVADSIQNNRATVIKASSGQGKTTMALQVAYNLESEYTTYKLLSCNDIKTLENIIQFFASRVKLGEKPLILMDNLDLELREWNKLAQRLQEEVVYSYKLLLTTREDDWYSYRGDTSNIQKLRTIDLLLSESEAQSVYTLLSEAGKLHPSITNWKTAWSKVVDKQLLIEYIYLLTHGEMLAERISSQIEQMNNTANAGIKFEVLRKICFADICGIRLPAHKLIDSLPKTNSADNGEILKSIENEFLVRINTSEKYIEGLHPVRSQHIVDRLHEFESIDKTALQVIQISSSEYLAMLFSNLPKFIKDKRSVYSSAVEMLWNACDLSCYIPILHGLFAGSVMQYFNENRHQFDDINSKGGLLFLISELNPLLEWEQFGISVTPLDDIQRVLPDNIKIKELCAMGEAIPKLSFPETDFYFFCSALFIKLNAGTLFYTINDITSYSYIAYWLMNIDQAFNLSPSISLEEILKNKDSYSIDTFSKIMHIAFYGNNEVYMEFVGKNLSRVLQHLKVSTKSLRLYANEIDNSIYVEYILSPSDIQKGNQESVSRLRMICMSLPIFDTYCADALSPKFDLIAVYKAPNDACKAMPIKNLIITFRQEFTSLWLKTIMSNYECSSVVEWLEHWLEVRKLIVALFQKNENLLYKLLEGKAPKSLGLEIDSLRGALNKKLIVEFGYPNEHKPFEEKSIISENSRVIKNGYFNSAQNFFNQFIGLVKRETNEERMAIYNLKSAHSMLKKMQEFFRDLSSEQGILQSQFSEICLLEEQCLQRLMAGCLYYREHQPNPHFSKYQIAGWYEAKQQETMSEAKLALDAFGQEHSIIFPKEFFYEGALSYYPVIVHGLDVLDGQQLITFLYNCLAFAELNFDYLVIVFAEEGNTVMPTGLEVPKKFLKDLGAAIETENEASIEEIVPPFPQEITTQILECFDEQYKISLPRATDHEGVDEIAVLLWTLSKSREILTDSADIEYLQTTEDSIKADILQSLSEIQHRVSELDYRKLSTLCHDVFNGKAFDDKDFNLFLDKLIAKAIEPL